MASVSVNYGGELRTRCRKLLDYRAVMLEHGITSYEIGEYATRYLSCSPHCFYLSQAIPLTIPILVCLDLNDHVINNACVDVSVACVYEYKSVHQIHYCRFLYDSLLSLEVYIAS